MYIMNPPFRIPFTSYLYMCTALKKTNTMDTVNMKILITAFLCTFITAVHSTKYNSSLLESKIEGGCKYKGDNGRFKKSLMALIVFNNPDVDTKYHFIAMGTFFTRKSVLSSKKCAIAVKSNKQYHRVVKLPVLNEDTSEIYRTAYSGEKKDKSVSSYGIIMLYEEADIDLEGHINLVPVEDAYYQPQYTFYSPGFVSNDEGSVLSYLILTLIDREECQQSLNEFGYKLRMNDICLRPHDGQFEDEDDGTPLYSTYNEVLGIANSFDYQEAQIIIYTDLAGQTNRIKKLLSEKEYPGDGVIMYTAQQEFPDTHQLSRAQSLNDRRRGKWYLEGSSPTLQPMNLGPTVARSRNSGKGRHPQTSNSEIRTQNKGEGSSSYEADFDISKLRRNLDREFESVDLGVTSSNITPDMSSMRYSDFEIEGLDSSRGLFADSPPQGYSISPIRRENMEELPRFRKDNDEASISCNIFKLPIKKFIKTLSFRSSSREKKSRDF